MTSTTPNLDALRNSLTPPANDEFQVIDEIKESFNAEAKPPYGLPTDIWQSEKDKKFLDDVVEAAEKDDMDVVRFPERIIFNCDGL